VKNIVSSGEVLPGGKDEKKIRDLKRNMRSKAYIVLLQSSNANASAFGCLDPINWNLCYYAIILPRLAKV